MTRVSDPPRPLAGGVRRRRPGVGGPGVQPSRAGRRDTGRPADGRPGGGRNRPGGPVRDPASRQGAGPGRTARDRAAREDVARGGPARVRGHDGRPERVGWSGCSPGCPEAPGAGYWPGRRWRWGRRWASAPLRDRPRRAAGRTGRHRRADQQHALDPPVRPAGCRPGPAGPTARRTGSRPAALPCLRPDPVGTKVTGRPATVDDGFRPPAGWTWYDGAGFRIAVPVGWLRIQEGQVACFRDPGSRRTPQRGAADRRRRWRVGPVAGRGTHAARLRRPTRVRQDQTGRLRRRRRRRPVGGRWDTRSAAGSTGSA